MLDVITSNNYDYSEHYWTFIAEQYHQYIINKVTVVVSNVNVSNIYQQDMQEKIGYSNTSVVETNNFPFVNGKHYAYSRTAGIEGFYVELFRSTDSRNDIDTRMSSKNLLRK